MRARGGVRNNEAENRTVSIRRLGNAGQTVKSLDEGSRCWSTNPGRPTCGGEVA